jgi:hypothetical protein
MSFSERGVVQSSIVRPVGLLGDDRDAGERVRAKNLSELVAKAMVRTSAPNETAPQ